MQPAIPRPVRLLTPRTLWLLTFVIGILFAIKLVDVIASGLAGTTDLEAYTAAAANVRAGAPIYWLPIVQGGTPPNYLYPPLLALAFTPFATYQTAWITWAILSLACWAGALAILVRERASSLDERLGATGWPLLWAALLSFPPVMLHIIWGQIGLTIVLCLCLGWYALQRNRDVWAGMLLGLTIALKVYPALLLLPLLIQRRWRALIAALATASVLTAVSFAAVGLDQTLFYVNHMLPAIADHGIGDVGNFALRDRLPLPLFAIVAALIVGIVGYVSWRGALADAFVLGTTAILLVSPVVWGHYFVLIFLPWIIALSKATNNQLWLLGGALLAMSTTSIVFYMPWPWAREIAQWLPALGALVLFWIQAMQTLIVKESDDERSRRSSL